MEVPKGEKGCTLAIIPAPPSQETSTALSVCPQVEEPWGVQPGVLTLRLQDPRLA